MSPALQITANAADVLAVSHDEAMTLAPGNVAVTGFAEVLETGEPFGIMRGAKRHPLLHIAEDVLTHVIHIRRGQLLTVTLSQVNSITLVESGRSYRVHHFQDDPVTPTVDFYCSIA